MFANLGMYLKEHVPQNALLLKKSVMIKLNVMIALILLKEELQKVTGLLANVPLPMIKLLLQVAQRIANAKQTRYLAQKL